MTDRIADTINMYNQNKIEIDEAFEGFNLASLEKLRKANAKSQRKFYANRTGMSVADADIRQIHYFRYNMVKAAEYRAIKKGIAFDLIIENIVIPTHCPVLGFELTLGGNINNSPSIDRINNIKGYTMDNICIISRRANALKSNASINELQAVLAYMTGIKSR